MSQSLEKTDPAEGTVNWDAAREHMLGKAAEGDEAATGEETKPDDGAREFRHRGKTIRVDVATHGILEDLRRDARGANGRLGSELAKTRERLALLEGRLSAAPEPTDPGLQPPDPLLATRDIAAWQRQYDAYQTAKLERHQRDLEAKYERDVEFRRQKDEQDRQARVWAERFYESYDHLDDPTIKPIVGQVWVEHKSEIDSFGDDVEGAHERLAELAEERIASVRKRGKTAPSTTNPRRPPNVETSAGPSPGRRSEETPREFSSSRWASQQRLKMTGRAPKA